MTTAGRSRMPGRLERLGSRARSRLGAAFGIGVVATVVTGALGSWWYAPLVGWDVTASTFSAIAWWSIAGMDAEGTAAHARRDDPTRAATDLLVIGASAASLVAVGVVLVAAKRAHGGDQALLAGLAAASVALSWFLVHTLFTLRYARLYYSFTGGGGVDFKQSEAPRYSDFAYLAFTIGMTFQVSDTDLTAHRIRASALRHALLSYLFGAVILATMVNFVVSLSSAG